MNERQRKKLNQSNDGGYNHDSNKEKVNSEKKTTKTSKQIQANCANVSGVFCVVVVFAIIACSCRFAHLSPLNPFALFWLGQDKSNLLKTRQHPLK